jgi:hypothetical protein
MEGTMETTLDDVALEVENKIKSNPTLNRTVLSMNLVTTEMDVSSIGDKPIGAARLTYEAIYEE